MEKRALILISKSPGETKRLGKKIGKLLLPGDTVALIGELGTGKTVFSKGIAQGLGIKRNLVRSPSFVLVKEYSGKIPLFHFDLYRLKRAEELNTLGYEEYFSGKGVVIIEWAEKAKNFLPEEYLKIELSFINENERKISLTVKGEDLKKRGILCQ
ncbi:MAG: tRNA (adenosine(37)-N6)-threonylcarbamoyltransferase complex ATPase subunit type 1 TsaE [bacterium (Candidatus Ratteibacteria) CG_4_10_14_3_um_filter_41_18]|uniref:tRNA threonylcarbamoyladenosine biosynthesis protein TsaE n=3 Tax=Candidatus Ratteibacteria TaxID=2979319 RepID=A0A2M7YF66_9BACT|nr:MAG: tRNA (adenosine(37)-N6)-threonylcarbamoyltransferase complex ATPase subunit type 1 TsaE [bacterium (Candidatus Ratteibacteria) CG01_land_8_20_14_3_00_40_19]PIX76537.1 MAG: tRNA (adenosine(37)-N6)-threonylcarbamoyltransferase complex ATPase subunit type 1 TsaE [bacterium (Candidatus Ratteibacteria) CG_4_10_14_3_um_filter_41_18]PJA61600.1 MAG: tRNA (adenosine(37)-N6)-threonylcarbamoyltransferase complex ATPase subunit type 1 TsaE [bacterium (Candidatus Ratteibacteria) CG_4_9_14_3_um_filter_